MMAKYKGVERKMKGMQPDGPVSPKKAPANRDERCQRVCAFAGEPGAILLGESGLDDGH
jgi:hypothetical protein